MSALFMGCFDSNFKQEYLSFPSLKSTTPMSKAFYRVIQCRLGLDFLKNLKSLQYNYKLNTWGELLFQKFVDYPD